MLQLSYIRTHADEVRRAIAQKGVRLDIDALLALDSRVNALKNEVPAGQRPSITVTAEEAIRAGTLTLTRLDDKKTFRSALGALAVGKSRVLPIGDGRAGVFSWKGTLSMTLAAGGTFNQDLIFKSATVSALRVVYDRERLDLENKSFEFQLSSAAKSAAISVIGEDGGELARGEASYKGEAPGTWLKITWAGKSGNVLRLDFQVVDTTGLRATMKFYPWSVSIPHEEVVFGSGKAEVRASEEQKLDAGYQKIVDAIAKIRNAEPSMPVKLYIAGHTDTVGGADENRKLSLARAQAIARFYGDRGLPLAVMYAGFGEDALRVKTADNVDEAKNRRADYVVAIEAPMVARGVRPKWYELR